MNLLAWLVGAVGLAGTGTTIAAYYYGVRTGRALERDINDAKIMKVIKKMQAEGLKEVTAKHVSDAFGSGTI